MELLLFTLTQALEKYVFFYRLHCFANIFPWHGKINIVSSPQEGDILYRQATADTICLFLGKSQKNSVKTDKTFIQWRHYSAGTNQIILLYLKTRTAGAVCPLVLESDGPVFFAHKLHMSHQMAIFLLYLCLLLLHTSNLGSNDDILFAEQLTVARAEGWTILD